VETGDWSPVAAFAFRQIRSVEDLSQLRQPLFVRVNSADACGTQLVPRGLAPVQIGGPRAAVPSGPARARPLRSAPA